MLTGHFIRYTCSIACLTYSEDDLLKFKTKHQNWKERQFKWLWTWHFCLCQRGRSQCFRNCWSTGIFLIPWSRWATAAEDHTGCHSCELRRGNRGYNSHKLTKTGQWKVGKMLPDLTSLDFSCNIQMVGSEFGVNNSKTWIYLALFLWLMLVVV